METVAGITAMQDLASRAGLSLAEGTEPVTLVPLNGGIAALDQALARGGTVVGYKVGAAASPAPAVLRDRLQAAGRLDAAVIGARLGLAGELIAPAAELLCPPPSAPETTPTAPAVPPAPAPNSMSDSLPARAVESHSLPHPRRPPGGHSGHSVPVHADRPRPPGRRLGAGLTTRPSETQAPAEPEVTPNPPATPNPNHGDVTSPWSGPPRCHIAVVERPAEVPAVPRRNHPSP